MYSQSHKDILHLRKEKYAKGDWIKGSLLILAANVSWCSWLIMKVNLLTNFTIHLQESLQNVS